MANDFISCEVLILTTNNTTIFRGSKLTFFRNGFESDKPKTSPWDIRNFYLAHFTLSDIEGDRFYRDERVHRSSPGLAGASLEEKRIWNGNWQVDWLEPENPLGLQRMRAVSNGFEIELDLTPAIRICHL